MRRFTISECTFPSHWKGLAVGDAFKAKSEFRHPAYGVIKVGDLVRIESIRINPDGRVALDLKTLDGNGFACVTAEALDRHFD